MLNFYHMILSFINVNNIYFHFLQYDISYLEFAALSSTLICVILVARASIWNWPFGILGVTLYALVFYQYQLYSDMFLQIFFGIANCYGWVKWLMDSDSHNKVINTYWANTIENLKYVIFIIIGTGIMGLFMSNISHIFPTLFPKPAAFPYIDSSIAILSFAATIWQIKKRINQWILWIIVDIIAITVYYIKHIPFTSFLYIIFLFISIGGLSKWITIYNTNTMFRTISKIKIRK